METLEGAEHLLVVWTDHKKHEVHLHQAPKLLLDQMGFILPVVQLLLLLLQSLMSPPARYKHNSSLENQRELFLWQLSAVVEQVKSFYAYYPAHSNCPPNHLFIQARISSSHLAWHLGACTLSLVPQCGGWFLASSQLFFTSTFPAYVVPCFLCAQPPERQWGGSSPLCLEAATSPVSMLRLTARRNQKLIMCCRPSQNPSSWSFCSWNMHSSSTSLFPFSEPPTVPQTEVSVLLPYLVKGLPCPPSPITRGTVEIQLHVLHRSKHVVVNWRAFAEGATWHSSFIVIKSFFVCTNSRLYEQDNFRSSTCSLLTKYLNIKQYTSRSSARLFMRSKMLMFSPVSCFFHLVLPFACPFCFVQLIYFFPLTHRCQHHCE